jgi:hypothetical protein
MLLTRDPVDEEIVGGEMTGGEIIGDEIVGGEILEAETAGEEILDVETRRPALGHPLSRPP